MINSEMFLTPIQGKDDTPFVSNITMKLLKATEEFGDNNDVVSNSIFYSFDIAFKAGFELGKACKKAEIEAEKELEEALKDLKNHLEFDRLCKSRKKPAAV